MKPNLFSLSLSLFLVLGGGAWFIQSNARRWLGSSEEAPIAGLSKIWTTASSEPAHADSEIQRDVNAIESSGLANAAREYQASFTDLNGRLPEGSRLERRSITLEELEAPLRDGNRLAIELGDRQRERLSGLETTLKDAHRDLKRRASAKELDEALESAGDHLDEALVSAGDQFDRALKSAGRQVEGALR